jgi:hypothetical protein
VAASPEVVDALARLDAAMAAARAEAARILAGM